MHFLKAVSILACVIPLSCATNFKNGAYSNCWVRDRSGRATLLSTYRSVDIANGWAFVYTDSDKTSIAGCYGFPYEWPAYYGNVIWLYEVTASLVDASTY
ncbi:hypothetical protein V8E54_012449 [Elaphomyces granulatus]